MRKIFAGFAYLCMLVSCLLLMFFVLNAPIPFTIDKNIIYENGYVPNPLLINLGLLVVFGLQHSIMARQSFKKRLAKYIHPSLERSVFVFVSAITLAIVCVFWVPVTDPVLWEIKNKWVAYGILTVMAGGLIINNASSYMIDHFELFGINQAFGLPIRSKGFVTPYLYKFMRHPIYTGFLVFFWATPIMTLGHFFFAIGMSIYVLIGIHFEEKKLMQDFREYAAYKRRVPGLIPFTKTLNRVTCRRWVIIPIKALVAVLILLLVVWTVTFKADYPADLLKKKYSLPSSHFMMVSGTNIHYTDDGTGEILLLLHGSGSSLHTWTGWTERLEYNYRVIRVDLPGFGLSAEPVNNNYSVEYYTAFIKKFTELLGITKFSVAGNSLGGRIAWEYALAFPETINKLVLVSSAGYQLPGDPGPPMGIRMASNSYISPVMRWISFRSFFRKAIGSMYADPNKLSDSLLTRYYELGLKEKNRAAFINRAKTQYVNNKDVICQISCPVLIMWGEKDNVYPVAHAYRFKEDIPHAELKIYRDAGHIVMEEKPMESVMDLIQFLSNNRQKTGTDQLIGK